MKLSPEVQEFASLMEKKLRENDDKGGWQDCDQSWLLKRLLYEVGELAEALLRGDEDVEEECADVANFAMMIADNSRALKGEGE